jgi:hypothetical protein
VITKPNVSGNFFGCDPNYEAGTSGAIATADAIRDMGALTKLDISNNSTAELAINPVRVYQP